MARKIKTRNPNVITVIGGANCESPMGQEIARYLKYIDFVFSGPALRTFPEIVGYLLDHEIEKCDKVDGVFTKKNCSRAPVAATAGGVQDGNGTSALPSPETNREVTLVGITRTTSKPSKPPTTGAGDSSVQVGSLGAELDLDVNTDLDYEGFLDTLDRNFPNKKVEPSLLFETSRGCWWGEKAHCTFCGLNGATMNYRAMSPVKAIEQFAALFKYGDRCSSYQCVDNILAKNYVKEVFPFINPPSKSMLFYEIKADLNAEDLQALARAHVKLVQPGIESLATSTLQLMKKGTSVFQNLMLLKNCAMFDIFPVWNLLIGFPGEGEAVYKKYVDDLPLLVHLPPPNGAYPVRFDRYSPYFTKADEYGLDLEPFDFYAMTYPFGKEVLANIAYYFVDANYNAAYRIALAAWISRVREGVSYWRKRWQGEGSQLPARLFLKKQGEETVVYDSRSGQVVEHRISDAGVQMLGLLEKTQRLSQLESALGHLPGINPAGELALLKERRLVFQEHDRFLSIVLPKEPPSSFMLAKGDQLSEQAKDSGAGMREPVLAPVSREAHRTKQSL
jgi:hypothetical protein